MPTEIYNNNSKSSTEKNTLFVGSREKYMKCITVCNKSIRIKSSKKGTYSLSIKLVTLISTNELKFDANILLLIKDNKI